MKVYVQGLTDRQESKEVLERITESISKRYEVVNSDLKTDLYKAEEADVVVARLDSYDDSTWAVIGMARAGNRPVVPYWGASYDYPDANSIEPKKVYGFTRDVHLRNRHLVRTEKNKKEWPSTNVKGVLEDLRILEQKRGWRKQRVKKPGKENVNLNLPPYIMGDSRLLENCWAFYDIEEKFIECGIPCITPPKVLDGYYKPEEYPKLIDMSSDSSQDCVNLASHLSGILIGRIDAKSLMGERFEEGVGWFNAKPILYQYRYLFPPRNPYHKYLQRQNPGMHFASVFKQNEDLWGIRVHAAQTPEELAGVIFRTRNMNGGEK